MSIVALIPFILLFVSLYFEVFLLVSFFERRFLATHVVIPEDNELPRVAIVVPCFNEARTLSGTMHSLLALQYPPEKLAIIVVDDGSRDDTLAVAGAFATDSRVRIFSKENGGKHSAMNYALANTAAECIGCLDADSIVSSDALMHIIPAFKDEKIGAVTPGIHVRAPSNFLQHLQHVEYRLSIFNRFIFSAIGSAFITPGPFSIFRTEVVRTLGGWQHGHSTEDMEMALRMQEKGFLIANAPKAMVHTTTPRTFGHLFRQRVRWTYGFLRNSADYRHMFWNRSYGNLGLIVLPAALISIGTALYFSARMVIYGILSLRETLLRLEFGGPVHGYMFDVFYLNTSAVMFLVYAAVLLILVLISAGSFIGTGKRTPPASTPLFLVFYGFLAPFWLGTALVRAVFKTGVRWR